MNASAFFSGGGSAGTAPPPNNPNPPPPRPSHGHGGGGGARRHPPPRQQQQQQHPIRRTHSRSEGSNASDVFETLDLDGNTPTNNAGNADNANSFFGAGPPPPAQNFAAASSGPENFSNYASGGPENFSMPQQQQQHQRQPSHGGGGEETFEYEGVALQTALTAFGSVASAAGGLAGGFAGGVGSVAGGVVGGVTRNVGGVGNVMSSVTPSRLAGGMASWRGRLADVVAPTTPSSANQLAQPPGNDAARLFGRASSGGSATAANSAAEAFARAPSEGPQTTGGAAQSFGRAPSGGSGAAEDASRAFGRGASQGSSGSAAQVFGAPSPKAGPVAAPAPPPAAGFFASQTAARPAAPASGGHFNVPTRRPPNRATEAFGSVASGSAADVFGGARTPTPTASKPVQQPMPQPDPAAQRPMTGRALPRPVPQPVPKPAQQPMSGLVPQPATQPMPQPIPQPVLPASVSAAAQELFGAPHPTQPTATTAAAVRPPASGNSWQMIHNDSGNNNNSGNDNKNAPTTAVGGGAIGADAFFGAAPANPTQKTGNNDNVTTATARGGAGGADAFFGGPPANPTPTARNNDDAPMEAGRAGGMDEFFGGPPANRASTAGRVDTPAAAAAAEAAGGAGGADTFFGGPPMNPTPMTGSVNDNAPTAASRGGAVGADAFFGAPPTDPTPTARNDDNTPTAAAVRGAGGADAFFGGPSANPAPTTRSSDAPMAAAGGGAGGADAFFGGPPANPTPTSRSSEGTPTPTAAGGASGADAFFGNPPTNPMPTAGPTPTASGDDRAPALSADQFFGAARSTRPVAAPRSTAPTRHLSHRLSTLEKGRSRDPAVFQYADPLEGRATIIPGRNLSGSAGGPAAIGGGVSVPTPSAVEVVAPSSGGAIPAAPATGNLKLMEIGSYLSSSAAATAAATTATEMFQGGSGGQQTQQWQRPAATAAQPSPRPQPSAAVQSTMPSATPAGPKLSEATAPPSKPVGPSTTSAASKVASRRLHLPVPKKAALPLPPPLPARKKIARPPTSGNSAGLSSLGSHRTAGSATPFRRPPPMEVVGGSSGHTPRFHLPEAGGGGASPRTTPRFHTPGTRIRDGSPSGPLPTPSTTVPALPLPGMATGAAMPEPSPRAAAATETAAMPEPSPRAAPAPFPSPVAVTDTAEPSSLLGADGVTSTAAPPTDMSATIAVHSPTVAEATTAMPVPLPGTITEASMPDPSPRVATVVEMAPPRAMAPETTMGAPPVPSPRIPPVPSPRTAEALTPTAVPPVPPLMIPPTGAAPEPSPRMVQTTTPTGAPPVPSPRFPPVPSPRTAEMKPVVAPPVPPLMIPPTGAPLAPSPRTAEMAMTPTEAPPMPSPRMPPMAPALARAPSPRMLPTAPPPRSQARVLVPPLNIPSAAPPAPSPREAPLAPPAAPASTAMATQANLAFVPAAPPTVAMEPDVTVAAMAGTALMPGPPTAPAPRPGAVTSNKNVFADVAGLTVEEVLEDAVQHVVAAAVPVPPPRLNVPNEKRMPAALVMAHSAAPMVAPAVHPAALPAGETMPPARDTAPPPPAAPTSFGDAIAAAAAARARSDAATTPSTPTDRSNAMPSAGATFSATSPPLYPDNVVPETPSSRVTECDVMSDYQAHLREEDFDGVVATPSATIDETMPAEYNSYDVAEEDEGADMGDIPESSMIVEADRLSDYQDQLAEEDVPDDDVFNRTPMEEAAPTPPAPPAALPEGWVEGVDPSSGRTYYYHGESGVSSWDRPWAPDDGAEEPPEGGEESLAYGGAGGDVRPSAVAESDAFHPELDAGVGGATAEDEADENDPLSQEFWVGALSEEPRASVAGKGHPIRGKDDVPLTGPSVPSVGERLSAGMEGAEESQPCEVETAAEEEEPVAADDEPVPATEEDEDAKISPLPEGWIEGVDPSSGNIYYYNAETGESRWDRPAEENVITEENDEAGERAAEEVDQSEAAKEDAVGEKEPLPMEDEDHGDNLDKVQQPQESTAGIVDEDAASIQSEMAARAESSARGMEEVPAAEEPPQIEALPVGWIEAVDPTSGRAYYYNSETGATSWERPMGKAEGTAEEGVAEEVADYVVDDVMEEAASLGGEGDEGGETPAPADDHRDHDGLREEDASEQIAAGTAREDGDVELPLENENLLDGAIASTRADGDEAQKEKEEKKNDVSLSISSEPSLSALPEGWVEAIDPSSGNTYYYHQVTGVSSWERPGSSGTDGGEGADDGADKARGEEPAAAGEQEATEDVGDGHTSDLSATEDADVLEDDESSPKDIAEAVDDGGEVPSAEEMTGAKEAEEEEEEGDLAAVDVDAAVEGSEEDEEDWVSVTDPDSGKVYHYHRSTSRLIAEADDDDIPSIDERWMEATDPATGKVYYYDTVTGVTSWTRPVYDDGTLEEGAEGEEEEDEGSQSIAEDDGSMTCFEGGKEAPSAAKVAAAEDAQEQPSVDASGSKTDTVVDDREEEAVAAEEDGGAANGPVTAGSEDSNGWTPVDYRPEDDSPGSVSELVEGDIKEPSKVQQQDPTTPEEDFPEESEGTSDELPEGWAEATDPTSGNVYYYNETTGATSWDRPKSEKVAIEEPLAEEPASMGAPGEQHELTVVSDAPKDATVMSTEDDAEEMTAVSSEKVESLALASGSSVAEEKSTLHAVEEPAAETTSNDAAEGSEADGAVMESTSLPDGWIEATDPTSGNVYYYNKTTGATSWNRPETEKEAEQQPSDEEPSSSEVPQEQHEPSVVSDGPEDAADPSTEDDVEETTAPTSKKVEPLAPMSGPSIVEEKLSSVAGEEPVVESRPDDAAEGGELEGAVVESSSLPDGWAEATDPTSGNVYYFNETTGATSWDRPQPEKVAEEEPLVEEPAVAPATSMDDAGPSTEDDAEETAAPAIDNVESSAMTSDPSIAEESTSLAVEEPAVESRSDDAAEGGEADVSLLDGWIEATDPTSGSVYYYHAESGASSWERPVAEQKPAGDDSLAIPGAALSSAAGEDATEKEEAAVEEATEEKPEVDTAGGEKAEAGPESSDVAAVPSDVAVVSALPEGWVETVDPGSGKVYYYHETSGETSWDRPRPSGSKDVGLDMRKTAVNDAPVAAPTAGSASVAATQHRPRPAHAIATFGFGGRLCVMIPQVAASLSSGAMASLRRGPVVVRRLRDLVPSDHEHSVPPPLASSSVLSLPLIRTPEDQVLSHLETMAGSAGGSGKSGQQEVDRLLWSVINIAAQNRGRLRNDKKAKLAIVDLVLSSTDNEEREKKTDVAVKQSGKRRVGENAMEDATNNLKEVQSLLLRGDRESAVSEALDRGNYALALLMASMCDRTTYQIAARRFADEALSRGSPLHTATLMFSNNLEIPEEDSGDSFWCGEEYGDLEGSWREQLASILSNQTARWERIVLSLGDRLLQLGRCQAAHVCYLVSFTPFGPPARPSTRLALLGCDHAHAMHCALATPGSIRAFLRTEAFEWARRRGNRKTHIPSLQPFKLRYAELLADFGREAEAREALLGIRSCIGLDQRPGGPATGHSGGASTASGNFSTAMLHDGAFVESLRSLDDRICGSTGARPSSWGEDVDRSKGGGAAGLFSALGSSMWGVLGKKQPSMTETMPPSPKPKSTSEDDRAGGQDEVVCEELRVPQPTEVSPLPEIAQDTLSANNESGTESMVPDKDVSATAAKLELAAPSAIAEENTPKSPPLLSNPFGHAGPLGHASQLGTEPTGAEGDNDRSVRGGDRPFGIDDGGAGPVSSSAPPTLGVDVGVDDGGKEEPRNKEPREEKKEPAAFPSTPSNDAKEKGEEKKKKAPVSEPPRSAGWLSKFLGRGGGADKEPKATVADVGEEMKAYYDDKLKRWIFPGDDPAEVAKPLAPPPMIPKKKEGATEPPSTPAATAPSSSDPLAMLMAPPPRSGGLASGRRGIPAAAARRYAADPLASMGGGPSNGKKTPASPMAPPTFAVFQPKPASATPSSSEPAQGDED